MVINKSASIMFHVLLLSFVENKTNFVELLGIMYSGIRMYIKEGQPSFYPYFLVSNCFSRLSYIIMKMELLLLPVLLYLVDNSGKG